MYSEQYSSRQGSSTISVAEDQKSVTWSINVGGQDYHGTVPVEPEHGVEWALAQARRTIDNFTPDAAEVAAPTEPVSSGPTDSTPADTTEPTEPAV